MPVVTLVGYYDPEKQLHTTIYPSLFGNYGFTYAGEEKSASCQLMVNIKNNQSLYFSLSSSRQLSGKMNKFHVNVAQSDQPTSARIICNDLTLDTLGIPSAPTLPEVNVYGMPVE